MTVDPLEDWIETEIDPKEKEQLEAIAKARGVDVDTIVREALQQYIVTQT